MFSPVYSGIMFSMTEQMDVGRAVRRAREQRGLTLRSLAGLLGVSPATLSAVETGRTPLTVSRLHRIADLLDTSAADLVRGEPVSVPTPVLAGAAPGAWRDFATIAMDPVLEGATRVFVRRGFHATTVREIATEAGLSVAGVYHHYPSKEQVLVAVLDLTMTEIIWRVEAARCEGSDDLDAFALMVESLALFHAVRADLAFIGASEMRALSHGQRTRVTGLRDDVQHALDRQAGACIDEGVFVAEGAHTKLRAIATMCTSLPSWFRSDGLLDAPSVARAYAHYAVTLMRNDGPGRAGA